MIDFGSPHALVIGINDYKHFPKLNTATRDAEVVAGLLAQQYGFQVRIQKNATRSDILGAIVDLRGKLTSRDNLLVYYAGHGQYDRDAERGYWLGVDAVQGNHAEWVSNDDLTHHLKPMQAKHVLIVADSCYSGTLTRDVRMSLRSGGEEAWLKKVASKRSRTVLTSGALEPVRDGGGGDHSVFAKAFIDTLSENTKPVETTALYQDIKRRVVANARQQPLYEVIQDAGHDFGDFVFVPVNTGLINVGDYFEEQRGRDRSGAGAAEPVHLTREFLQLLRRWLDSSSSKQYVRARRLVERWFFPAEREKPEFTFDYRSEKQKAAANKK